MMPGAFGWPTVRWFHGGDLGSFCRFPQCSRCNAWYRNNDRVWRVIVERRDIAY